MVLYFGFGSQVLIVFWAMLRITPNKVSRTRINMTRRGISVFNKYSLCKDNNFGIRHDVTFIYNEIYTILDASVANVINLSLKSKIRQSQTTLR